MSMLPPDELEDEVCHPHSCYLLEFSVLPGGARHGDIHVATTADALRASMDERWMGDDVDGYLITSYGAVLHLWVVQEGEIVEGIDLHPHLRAGDGTRVAVASGDRATRDDMQVEGLHLDWPAIARTLPPLREPLFTEDRVSVRWADPALRHPDSHLHSDVDPAEPMTLHAGLNDVENGYCCD